MTPREKKDGGAESKSDSASSVINSEDLSFIESALTSEEAEESSLENGAEITPVIEE